MADLSNEFARYAAAPETYFLRPANAQPLACDLPARDLREIAGTLDLAEETEKISYAHRHFYRNHETTYRYDDVDVRLVSGRCDNGLWQGPVELWLTATHTTDDPTRTLTLSLVRRVFFDITEGKPTGPIKRFDRTLANQSSYKDAEFAKQVRKENKLGKGVSMSYHTFPKIAPSVVLMHVMVGRKSNDRFEVEQVIAEGCVEKLTYDGSRLFSLETFKDGVKHGPASTQPGTFFGIKGLPAVTQCYRDGEIYQDELCEVD